jgi:soluble lytic murein transglycosylase-like protein
MVSGVAGIVTMPLLALSTLVVLRVLGCAIWVAALFMACALHAVAAPSGEPGVQTGELTSLSTPTEPSSKQAAQLRYSMSLQALSCIRHASQKAQLPEALLLAIAWQESGLNPHARYHNANGSLDLGLMQINSVHWPRLQREFGLHPQHLLNPCLNALFAAVLLNDLVNKHGLNATAIGYYHSATPALRQRYAQQVCRWLQGTRICA